MTISTPAAAEIAGVGWHFNNTYASLPESLFRPATPKLFRAPHAVVINNVLAENLGLNVAALSPASAGALFSGQVLPSGSQPIAQAYAGHQFGHFTQLGDGRAILLGEHRTPSGQLVDIQFKGSGPTSYSRRGDGLAALAPMLREYIISEAMAALGIPTTRSLAVVTTGELVQREGPRRGAVLTRVATSHIRVGTFEYAAATEDLSVLTSLADYAIDRHYPEVRNSRDKYLDFFCAVVQKQAALLAQWQLVGFVHGVMNTDNMSISGETIDYGPCAFMNRYDPHTVFSSIDRDGRYAYSNQPVIAQWNLARFAETLLPLFGSELNAAIELATGALKEFSSRFQGHWLHGMRLKLGLQGEEVDDKELFDDLFIWMAASASDFTSTFRDLSSEIPPTVERYQSSEFLQWHSRWEARLTRQGSTKHSVAEGMARVNPVVIARNHRVEEALSSAEEEGNFELFSRLVDVLSTPYSMTERNAAYRDPPANEEGYRTFCGT